MIEMADQKDVDVESAQVAKRPITPVFKDLVIRGELSPMSSDDLFPEKAVTETIRKEVKDTYGNLGIIQDFPVANRNVKDNELGVYLERFKIEREMSGTPVLGLYLMAKTPKSFGKVVLRYGDGTGQKINYRAIPSTVKTGRLGVLTVTVPLANKDNIALYTSVEVTIIFNEGTVVSLGIVPIIPEVRSFVDAVLDPRLAETSLMDKIKKNVDVQTFKLVYAGEKFRMTAIASMELADVRLPKLLAKLQIHRIKTSGLDEDAQKEAESGKVSIQEYVGGINDNRYGIGHLTVSREDGNLTAVLEASVARLEYKEDGSLKISGGIDCKEFLPLFFKSFVYAMQKALKP